MMLLPPRYFTERFSSTIMTSMNTGTPVLATLQLLHAYSYLTTDSVFVQACRMEGGDEGIEGGQ